MQIFLLGLPIKFSIEPDQQSLSEVVISGYSSKRKDLETMKRSSADSTFPAGGWQSFQEYVYKKMKQTIRTLPITKSLPRMEALKLNFPLMKMGILIISM
jgi:hypothetical protein